MRRTSKKLADLPLEERALIALRAAVKKAIAQRHRLGLPAYIWRNGHIEELAPARRRISRKPSNQGKSRSPAKARTRKGKA